MGETWSYAGLWSRYSARALRLSAAARLARPLYSAASRSGSRTALARDAARELLRQPLASLSINITDSAIGLAVTHTAGHPNLLQYLGTLLVNDLSDFSRLGIPLQVDEDRISRTTTSPPFRDRFV